MGNVFLLWHTHFDKELDGGEDVKLIGVYSSRELAENTLEKMSKVAGFKDQPEGFEISEYSVDKDHWTSGFITE
ncbi:DUF7336 domain-containing protein [Sphingobacterium sp. UBA2074]|uniref:DUF7336 domain-containing protein n=1 Tax=Sphingobacterium sp. UBA2074 TaxID=1947487 RepID=UPI00257B0AF2|nr:hypothetical protein [Sphingobacterium sp. UBA2074]